MENEGVTTDESPTAEMEVVPTAESPNTFLARPILDQRFAENEGVLTAESPTSKIEVVSTAESPTQRTSREKQAIRRNARNQSGHMANEGDESQFNSLSPSTINLKQDRRVTYSVNLGHEGAQSSTSMPSEGESLRNVVNVDPILMPHYKPIDMTTVGLRRSKRRNQRKRNATQ